MTFADMLKEKFQKTDNQRIQSARITSTKLQALPKPETPVEQAAPGTWDPFTESKIRSFERNVALVTGDYPLIKPEPDNTSLASSAMSSTIKSNSEQSRSHRIFEKPQAKNDDPPLLAHLRDKGFE